eukprot:NODE_5135_length_978_cov_122.342690_g4926_i0.p1 GENE.NODE_5135_length_978_cov_122.342690_g4926_i0~~NODE_5135_length_978_cov_122.342690_g4926_i0.p1  ORF type:complete len:277 (+),score=74.41 NODE_5135_length_978_cov_122.342690_g4926_i0:66-833(+)
MTHPETGTVARIDQDEQVRLALRKREKEKAREVAKICDDIASANVHGVGTFELVNSSSITELPTEISHLTKVRRLNCSNNFRLTHLPESFGDLYERLEILNLSYNKLKEFPLCLCRLKYLTRLDINNNEIRSLPTKVDQLKSLETWYMDSNFLMALPYTICHLKHLKQLFIENNPLLVEEAQGEQPTPPVDANIKYCSVTGEELGEKTYSFVNFADFAGNKRMPIHYVCASEQARDLVIEEKDAEQVDYWTLKYN